MSDGAGGPEGPWLDPGEEAPTGLLLFAPDAPGSAFADLLDAVLATGAAVALVLGPPGPDWRPALAACRGRGVASLARHDPALALSLGADGVHLDDPAGVAEARRRLGADALIGAACGRSRHSAMVAGEDGADYVMFSPGTDASPGAGASLDELCRWWTELFVLPCAADLREAAASDPGPPVRAGADFVAVGGAVWDGPADAPAAALELRRRIEAARAQRQGSR